MGHKETFSAVSEFLSRLASSECVLVVVLVVAQVCHGRDPETRGDSSVGCGRVQPAYRLGRGSHAGAAAALRQRPDRPDIAVHNGRVVKRTGDGALVEFRSVVDAVRCAIEVQNAMIERNAGFRRSAASSFALASILVMSSRRVTATSWAMASISLRDWRACRPAPSACPRMPIGNEGEARSFGQRSGPNPAQEYCANRCESIPRRSASPQRRAAGRAQCVPPSLSPRPAMPDKPSIAVLPFKNMSGDPEQEYFADGMVEDIITGLSRFHAVCDRAKFDLHLQGGGRRASGGRELGVRYVLEGGVASREPGCASRPVDPCGDGRPSVGEDSMVGRTMSSICRTRSLRAWSAPSPRNLKRPKSSARSASQQRTWLHMIISCEEWRIFIKGRKKEILRHFGTFNKRPIWIRIFRRHMACAHIAMSGRRPTAGCSMRSGQRPKRSDWHGRPQALVRMMLSRSAKPASRLHTWSVISTTVWPWLIGLSCSTLI